MSVLPVSLTDLVVFVEDHLAVWTTPANIGLTPAQITALTTQLSTTSGAISARSAAVNAAKASTLEQNTQGATLRALAADAVRSIKTYAEAQAKPDLVYAEAQIPAPAAPSPAGPPGQPTNLSVTVDPTSGALTLKWKCNNNGLSGVSYLIRRRAQGEASWSQIAITGGGEKTFVDASFQAGPDSVEYTVQGVRSGETGPLSSIFTVHFGVPSDSGAVTAFVTERSSGGGAGETRMAA